MLNDQQSTVGGTLKPGSRLNEVWEIDEKIAVGGMGEVYRGHNIHTDDRVAIKVVRLDLVDADLAMAMFRKEAAALNTLYHEAIVRYYMFALDPTIGRPYLVMEYVEGRSLKAILADRPLSYAATRILAERVGAGLAAAHDHGIFHRDISPDNIILPTDDAAKAKIIDFGIARNVGGSLNTVIGQGFAGKYSYASPEQIGAYGGEIGARSDIYSLALVLAEANTGKRRDMIGSALDVIEKRQRVPDLSDIDPRLQSILAWMLAPDPDNRPVSLHQVLAELRGEQTRTHALVEPPGETVMSSRPPRGLTGRDSAQQPPASVAVWDWPQASPSPPAPPARPSGAAKSGMRLGLTLAVSLAAAAAIGGGAWWMLEQRGGVPSPAAPLPTANSPGQATTPPQAGTKQADLAPSPRPVQPPPTTPAPSVVPTPSSASSLPAPPANEPASPEPQVKPAPPAVVPPPLRNQSDDVALAPHRDTQPEPQRRPPAVIAPAPPPATSPSATPPASAPSAAPLASAPSAPPPASAPSAAPPTIAVPVVPPASVPSPTPTAPAAPSPSPTAPVVQQSRVPVAVPASPAPPPATPSPATPSPATVSPAIPSPAAPASPKPAERNGEVVANDDIGSLTIAKPTPLDVQRYLTGYARGNCIYLQPLRTDIGAAATEAYGSSVRPFEVLDGDFQRTFGFAIDIDLHLVMPAHCAILDYMAKAGSSGQMDLTIDTAKLSEKAMLTGLATTTPGRRLGVVLVEDDGTVRPIAFAEPGSSKLPIRAPLVRRTSGGDKPQLVLAIASAADLDLFRSRRSLSIADFLKQLAASAERDQVSLRMKYLVVTR